jgi:hypothetical protein
MNEVLRTFVDVYSIGHDGKWPGKAVLYVYRARVSSRLAPLHGYCTTSPLNG